jgi:hypothetical protein
LGPLPQYERKTHFGSSTYLMIVHHDRAGIDTEKGNSPSLCVTAGNVRVHRRDAERIGYNTEGRKDAGIGRAVVSRMHCAKYREVV